MKRTHHIMVATRKPYVQVAECLGPKVQIHLAQDTDECLTLGSSLQPALVLVDLSVAEFAQADFLKVLCHTLGEEVPVVGWAEPSRKGKVRDLLQAGLRDIWSWSEPSTLHSRRIALWAELQETRRALRRAQQERVQARKAVIRFLLRLEDALTYPLDNLDAYLNILYTEIRRHAESLLPQLDRMATQHRELREVLLKLHRLAHTLDRGTKRKGGFSRSLEDVATVMDPPRGVRTHPPRGE